MIRFYFECCLSASYDTLSTKGGGDNRLLNPSPHATYLLNYIDIVIFRALSNHLETGYIYVIWRGFSRNYIFIITRDSSEIIKKVTNFRYRVASEVRLARFIMSDDFILKVSFEVHYKHFNFLRDVNHNPKL